jgi:hypothetical protein
VRHSATFVHGPRHLDFDIFAGIQALAFAPDGRLLASGGGPFDARVAVFDLVHSRCLADHDLIDGCPLEKHAQVRALSLEKEGTLVAVGDAADFPLVHLSVWSTHRGEILEAVHCDCRDEEMTLRIWSRS